MSKINRDSNFAKSILEVATHDNRCKAVIAKAADCLKEVVIEPILEKLNRGIELDKTDQQVIDFLASEHSKDGMQWGGAFQEHTKSEIMEKPDLQKELLQNLSARLSKSYILQVNDIDRFAGVLKAMTDCSFCYVERCPAYFHSRDFEYIKSMIFPTPDELAIRVSRVENGEGKYLATSYGIGTEVGKDIVLQDNIPSNPERKHNAGKAFFSTADVYLRAELIANAYDKATEYCEELKKKYEEGYSEIKIELDQAQKTVDDLKGKMQFYRVPLDKNERPNFKKLATPKPSIQKLAEFGVDDGQALPLVATASGTTARTLIALQDMGVFKLDDDQFDPVSAHYVSCALCGTIVHGGHHSVLEVGEMYNRLLDIHAIRDSEKGNTFGETWFDYYRIGDSNSIVPSEIRRSVNEKFNAKNQTDMKDQLKLVTDPDQNEVVNPIASNK